MDSATIERTYEDMGTASPKAAAMLAEELDTLYGVIGQLEDRLAYVLTPDAAATTLLASERPHSSNISPLADRLNVHAEQVAGMVARVHGIISRLDLPA